MANIKSINVTVMVSNLDRAIQFYTESLGLTLKNRYGAHWADIEGPGIVIGLHPTKSEVIKGNNLQIGIRVSDLEAEMSRLRTIGVKFNSTEDQVRLVHFQDPDGNILYLIQT
ncbi:MAG: VOC family protein [Saprospiraceae bacterium]|nr:VOC family protein [Saprospiraceae bacterium]